MTTTFSTFLAFFRIESRRLFSLRNWVIYGAIIILFLSCFFVNSGIRQYRDMEKKKNEFRTFESKKVESIGSYDQYGSYGFRLYFMPSPLSVLFCNSSHFTELTCRIDSGEKLDIHSLFKGKKIFEEKPGKLMDFSGIILLLGSLLSLFYGYEAYSHKEYMKFLSSLYGHRQTFLFIWLSRVILLCLLFLFVAFISVSLSFIMGTGIGLKHLFIFLALMLIMQVFFFTVGTIASSFESRLMGGLFIAVAWILAVYLVPALLNKRVESRVEKRQSDYQLELEKLEMLMPFEEETKALVEKVRRQYRFFGEVYNRVRNEIKTKEGFWTLINELEKRDTITQDEREILVKLVDTLKEKGDLDYEQIKTETYNLYLKVYTEGNKILPNRGRLYLEQEFPRIQARENELLKQIESDVDFFQGLFSLFPTTFYLSSGNEVGSRGYENTIDFYKNAITIKNEFLKFYMDNKYGETPGKIVDFIEEYMEKPEPDGKVITEANIYKAASRLPGQFGLGIAITGLWILLVLLLSYLFYKKTLFHRPKEKIIGLSDLEIELKKQESNVVLSNSKETISSYLYNVLSGKNRERIGTVSLEGVNIVTEKRKHDFVYICHPLEIPPDIKAGAFVSFFRRTLNISGKQFKDLSFKLDLRGVRRKSLGELKDQEKGLILLETALLKKSNIYMFYEFAKGMPADFIRRFTNRLQELKDDGSVILYLTNDVFVGRRIGDYISFLKKEAALMTGDF